MRPGKKTPPSHSVGRPHCRRFWFPRGIAPDLSDRGFLVDPELPRIIYAPQSRFPSHGFPLEQVAQYPVVGLLGQPGIGKSTTVKEEARRLESALRRSGDHVLLIDLAACDAASMRSVFEKSKFRSWQRGSNILHLFLDGFDTCLHYVPNIVALLLQCLEQQPRERMLVRIACRTTEWPSDLETGLLELWNGENDVAIIELAPLRRTDVQNIAHSVVESGSAFLDEVDRCGAAQFANRPITLKPLLKSFGRDKKLPAQKVALYRAGCLDLCDEWRPDLRRTPKAMDLSTGLRFAVASRIAALGIFCRRVAMWTASHSSSPPTGDFWIEETYGGEERFDREVVRDISAHATWAALNTGLFQSVAPRRITFSHQTYQDFLAAHYVAAGLSSEQILKLITHPDGSGKVVPQLRETAAWIAEMVPEVGQALIASDPTALLMSDTPPSSDQRRGELMRALLRRCETEEMIEFRIGGEMVWKHDRSKITYSGIADDLRRYVRDKARSLPARLIAIMTARIAELKDLQQDLLQTALDDADATKVRVEAAVTVRMIGDANSRAALKALLAVPPEQDPDDELRGAALAATWPDYLTADELFNALTRLKDLNSITEYRRFLTGDFAVHLRPSDMAKALQWAKPHATERSAQHQVLGIAALKIVVAAVGCFADPSVCSHLAEIVVHLARTRVPVRELMSRIGQNSPARLAIARKAIEVCEKDELGCLVMYGLVERESDIPFLLSELEKDPAPEVAEKIASLIAGSLWGIPWFDAQLIETVLAAAKTNPYLAAAMKPVLAPVSLDSCQAAEFRRLHEAAAQPGTVSESPAHSPDLISLVSSVSTLRFHDICLLLERGSGDPGPEEPLPGWNALGPDVQTRIVQAAEEFLKGCRVESTSWISTGEILSTETCGYWALRVLAKTAPKALVSLTDDVWHAWAPSVFGNHYAPQKPDGLDEAIIKTAYQRVPDRFVEILSHFLDAQSGDSREPVILDRVVPVWDRKIADLLRSALSQEQTGPLAFRVILAFLLEHDDAGVIEIARDRVSRANDSSNGQLDKAVFAAFELLASSPGEWGAIWDMVCRNGQFAQRLFASMAAEPYGAANLRIIKSLPEPALADLQIWLLHKTARDGDDQSDLDVPRIGTRVGPPFPEIGWPSLRNLITNNLLFRGTHSSTAAIRKIKEALPNEMWMRLEKDSEELVRDLTWTPLSPSEFLDLVLAPQPPAAEPNRTDKGDDKQENQHRIDIEKQRAAAAPVTFDRRFKRSGDIWELTFGGSSSSVKHCKGMIYIHLLLQSPDQALHSLELSRAAHKPSTATKVSADDRAGLSVNQRFHDPVLNERARNEYKERIDSLDWEIAEAERHNDIGRLETLRSEREFLIQQLSRDTGHGGRIRMFKTDSEKARKAVSRAINTALKNIKLQSEEMAQHLSSRIERGKSFIYRCDGIDWEF
jgi:hypothetical protein